MIDVDKDNYALIIHPHTRVPKSFKDTVRRYAIERRRCWDGTVVIYFEDDSLWRVLRALGCRRNKSIY